jgi:hypothetical protein
MFPQIICTLVIYSWLLPKMLSDPISQSEKESVRDSTSLTLVYQIFSFWWGKKTSFLSSVFIQGTRNTILLVISWNRHFRLKSLFTLKIHGPLWKMGFQHVFLFSCLKMRIERGSIPPPHSSFLLIYSSIAEIVVSGGMSMPQVLSTLDSSISVDRSWSERSWGWRK